MRKTEQKFWDRMRNNLGHKIHLERIENLAGAGIPDVLALSHGLVTFCELKAILEAPARSSTPLLGEKHGLSVDQRNWHLKWCKEGGRSLVLVGVGSKLLMAIDGRKADAVNSMTFDQMGQHSLAFSWSDVQRVLGAKL